MTQTPMKYLVWLKTTQGVGAPQTWSEDHAERDTWYPLPILAKIELKDNDRYMRINELVKKYPCPEIKDGC